MLSEGPPSPYPSLVAKDDLSVLICDVAPGHQGLDADGPAQEAPVPLLSPGSVTLPRTRPSGAAGAASGPRRGPGPGGGAGHMWRVNMDSPACSRALARLASPFSWLRDV